MEIVTGWGHNEGHCGIGDVCQRGERIKEHLCYAVLSHFSRVQHFTTLWTIALCLWDSPGKNTRVGCHALLQRIFPIQGYNPGLLHCKWVLYQLSHQGNPRILEWVPNPFSRVSSGPRKQTSVSCIAGRFSTRWATREALKLVYEQLIYELLVN